MDELRAGNPIFTGNITLVPIERCFIESDAEDMGGWLSGLKEPFAIIVYDGAGVRAFDTEATEIPVDYLIEKIPALNTLLASLAE